MKDARGHGSNARGALRALVRGGNPASPTTRNAESLLRSKFGYTENDLADLRGTPQAAHPKSAPVPTHDSMIKAHLDGLAARAAAQRSRAIPR
jgi:hypothetical protein